ncbi:hypothetical protein [Arcticibacter sp. MXS-1]|uniref:hypothetical protein n=1 Tax=Arcticibacter sp. MXS-1 TaxID=3341726 RepID=UPI0035A9AA9F
MEGKTNYERYRWTSFWLGLGIVIGVIIVICSSAYERFDWAIALLWSFGYLALGGLLGFIFSVPKIISGTPGMTPPFSESVNLLAQKRRVEENTNLTQISDWLTKVLIGAGLVELRAIPDFVWNVAGKMAGGLNLTSSQVEQIHDTARVFSASIILYFVTWGFISGYLVMKLVLTDQFLNSNANPDQ